jgi:RpiR family transcriptional regulator, carbohydrate utilization regulator
MSKINDCTAAIKSLYPSFYEVEKRIADYILLKPEQVMNMTVAQLSKEIGVADSSIVRFCQKAGFEGFTQLKINLAQTMDRPELLIMEDIRSEDDPYTVMSKVFAASINALRDALKMIDTEELSRAADALCQAERIEFYGVGTSAPVAMDAYYRFMRVGLPAYAATDPHISRISANRLNERCVAVAISHTGRTKDTVKTLEIAKNKGAKTICITSCLNSPITGIADIKLIAPTHESRFMKEAVSSRIAHIALLDGLYAYMAMRKFSTAAAGIEEMSEILDEMRY